MNQTFKIGAWRFEAKVTGESEGQLVYNEASFVLMDSFSQVTAYISVKDEKLVFHSIGHMTEVTVDTENKNVLIHVKEYGSEIDDQAEADGAYH
ncbi:hypothetical protein [Macrococcus lamae]|uniref:Uncharacterized protein n=1 Tax=Macrococcus lamae TaxID=198484 RepID=A0A4R6BVG4_9STAP|nr:hypothetical protein [Macrococcus lamae]TDM12282.1 hypothetical protein ERX29_04255 [Macrococcus lamae]